MDRKEYRPYTGPAYVEGADEVAKEQYRKQATALFGDTKLPQVYYKGEYYGERTL